METYTLKVKGMSCEGCQSAVEKAIGALAGVAAAKVDLAAGMATVEYEAGQAGPSEFAKAVEEAGFEAG